MHGSIFMREGLWWRSSLRQDVWACILVAPPKRGAWPAFPAYRINLARFMYSRRQLRLSSRLRA
jgi:hypothetical protein